MSDEALKEGGKTGKGNKKGKAADKPLERSAENAVDLRQLAADLAALRSEVAALKAPPVPVVSEETFPSTSQQDASAREDEVRGLLEEDETSHSARAALVFAYAYRPATESESEDSHGPTTSRPTESSAQYVAGPEALGDSSEESLTRAAKIAYALSSGPKVALARLLLVNGSQSAAQLGIGAGLTTGSLYHHLREMTHADVVAPAGRSRYDLTPLGRLATLLMLALARRS